MDVGNEGLSRIVSNLLLQPISLAESAIPRNSISVTSGKRNDDLKKFCADMRPILAKYPFNPMSLTDATLNDLESGFSPVKGHVSKYIQTSGSDLWVKTPPAGWGPNTALQGMTVSPELRLFLERSQQLSGTLFADNGNLRQLQYVLRSVRQNVVFHLVIDGNDKLHSPDLLQKTFEWPAPSGARPGAEGVFDEGAGGGFGQYPGLWGVFHLFQNADERALEAKDITWSETRGRGEAIPQKLKQTPKIQVVTFPGGVDLFNPKFFDALKCPARAVVVN